MDEQTAFHKTQGSTRVILWCGLGGQELDSASSALSSPFVPLLLKAGAGSIKA